MNLYSTLVASALFPLHEALKGHSTIRVHREMERSQWLAPEVIADMQLLRLRGFLAAIGRQVPYYRALFAALGFDPQAVRSLHDLRRLPLTGKPEIRANLASMKADSARQLQTFNTGGSSGEPLIFYLGKQRVSHDVAAKRRATRWWGVDIGDTEMVVWGSPIELNSQDRVRHLRDKLFRTRLLSAFEMSAANLDTYVDTIRRGRPKMLFGYPSSLSLIAAHAEASNIALHDLGIKVVFVTSERLYDYQREQMERTFGCPVANGYGGRDAGFIAHQCPDGAMHITAEDIVVEIVGDDGEVLPCGESGEIVVTHLCTGDFPFVRYPTGDVGTLSADPCSCGRGLPVLQDIQGRTTDFVIAPDGSKVHGLALIYILRELPEVGSFRIVQTALTAFVIQLVTDVADSAALEARIRQGFKRRLGESIEVDFEYVQEIPREKSGKYRYVVCKLPQAQASVV